MADASSCGWLRGKPWEEEVKVQNRVKKQTCAFVIVWGRLCREVDVKKFEKKDGTISYKVTAILALTNNYHAIIVAWGDNTISRILSSLSFERDNPEMVLAVGKERRYTYINRFDQENEIREIFPSLVIPIGHIMAIQDMYTNTGIQNVMNGIVPGSEDEESDAFESARYDDSQYDSESDFDTQEDAFESIDQMDGPWR